MRFRSRPTASSAPVSYIGGTNTAEWRGTTRLVVFLGLVLLGTSLDLWTKHVIFRQLGAPRVEGPLAAPPIWLIEGIFGFETSLNEGALFGLGQGHVVVFAVLSCVAGIGILMWLFGAGAARDLHLRMALGLVLAGILGNLYDRLGWHGLRWTAWAGEDRAGQRVYAVRDWLHFKVDAVGFDWPIFNLADSFLVCGAILLIWHAFRRQGLQEAH